MGEAWYLAPFKKQGTGSLLAWKNCGAAAGAMLTAQSSLGAVNPTPDGFRKATGDFSGGLYIAQIGNAIEQVYKQPVTIYDASDGLDWLELKAFLKRGRFAVVQGDYDQVPYALRGDKDFRDYHSVVYHRINAAGTHVRVGDGLNDGRRPGIPKGWIWWPLDVAKRYVTDFDREVPGTGLHAAVMDLRRVRARPVSPATNVRATATRNGTVIGKFGGTTLLAWGAKVKGESIAGNTTWFRVYLPSAGRVGFCHSSVVTVV